MYFRTTLKRNKEQFATNQKIKTPNTPSKISKVTSEVNVSQNTLNTSTDSNIYIPENLLNQIDENIFIFPQRAKLSSPLNYKLLEYPSEVKQQLEKKNVPNQYKNIGYAYDLFWYFANSKLMWWSYQSNPTSNYEFKKSDDPNISVKVFNEKIFCVSYGRFITATEHATQSIMVFIISFQNIIKFYRFSDNTLAELDCSVSTYKEKIQKMVISSDGNIYFAGDKGQVTLLKNISIRKKEVAFKYISSSAILFGYVQLDNPLKNYDQFKIEKKIKKIVINQQRKRIYCFIKKRHQDYWLARKLHTFFGIHYKPQQRFIIIYDISKTIQYSHEFSEHQFIQKFKSKYTQYQLEDNANLKIQDIFLYSQKQPFQLGLALKNGCLITLKNTRLLQFNIKQNPLCIKNSINIIMERIDLAANNKLCLVRSLGIDSLTCFQNKFAYSSKYFYDVYQKISKQPSKQPSKQTSKQTLKQKQKGNLFKRQIQNAEKKLQNQLFEKQNQFYYARIDGIDYFSKLKLVQILIVYLEIQSNMNKQFKKKVDLEKILSPVCQIYGSVFLCANLIEIICNTKISFEINQNVYSMTKADLYKLNNLPEISTFPDKNSTRKIISSPDIRQLAYSALKIFQKIIIQNRKNETTQFYRTQIFRPRLVTIQTDSLWHALLFYFHSIFDEIKDQSVEFFHSQKNFIHLCNSKFHAFSKFMENISSDQANLIKSKSTEKKIFGDYTTSSSYFSKESSVQKSNSSNQENVMISLINRIQKLITKIRKIIFIFPKLIFNKRYGKELTLMNLFLDQEVKQNFRERLFETLEIKDPYFVELTGVAPEILNQQHLIFEHWRKSQKRELVMIVQAVKIMDQQKLDQIQRFYINNKHYLQYIKILTSKLTYLETVQNQILNRIEGKNQNYFDVEEVNHLQKENMGCKLLVEKSSDMILSTLEIVIDEVKSKQIRSDIQILENIILQLSKISNKIIISKIINLLIKKTMICELREFKKITEQKYGKNTSLPDNMMIE